MGHASVMVWGGLGCVEPLCVLLRLAEGDVSGIDRRSRASDVCWILKLGLLLQRGLSPLAIVAFWGRVSNARRYYKTAELDSEDSDPVSI